MRNSIIVFVLSLCTGLQGVIAQINKQYIIGEKSDFGMVDFKFSSYKGFSELKRQSIDAAIEINCDLKKANVMPDLNQVEEDKVLYVTLDHKNVSSEGMGKSLSYRLFSSDDQDEYENKWQLGLNSSHLYNLDLNFGVGLAKLDLSQLSINQCKIKTASSDVVVNYSKNIPNSVHMDTFMVNVNMGSLELINANMTNAREMILDVSWGSILVSFTDNMANKSNVAANIGAGSLDIQLPSDDKPFIIHIKSTAFCSTSIPKTLMAIDKNTYVSRGYKKDAPNLLTFNVDVSMGSVTFR
ncbi:hypothetical protein [Penaeicola halotolerans]|uniref:hypothetical protein n=1 Tax=Penaeicola halotolerans TaxID=2793196 RepID=UPI001CF8FE25|nr:hypothetical protein [Penaeicola halotolerans]